MADLRPKEAAFLSCLLVEPTIRAAAAKAGLPERSAFRLFQDPDFATAYRLARREAVSHAVARLQQVSGTAVDTLAAVMDDSEAPPSARVTAATKVLEMALKAVELEDLAERVEQLEQAAADLAATGGRQR
jgi:hypothetical protein